MSYVDALQWGRERKWETIKMKQTPAVGIHMSERIAVTEIISTTKIQGQML
jgi:hypothetical protein